jgi:hypothetical protein
MLEVERACGQHRDRAERIGPTGGHLPGSVLCLRAQLQRLRICLAGRCESESIPWLLCRRGVSQTGDGAIRSQFLGDGLVG